MIRRSRVGNNCADTYITSCFPLRLEVSTKSMVIEHSQATKQTTASLVRSRFHLRSSHWFVPGYQLKALTL